VSKYNFIGLFFSLKIYGNFIDNFNNIKYPLVSETYKQCIDSLEDTRRIRTYQIKLSVYKCTKTTMLIVNMYIIASHCDKINCEICKSNFKLSRSYFQQDENI